MNTSIKTGEEVLELLLTKVSLSTYDKKFLYSLQVSNVYSGKPITTNQLSLFKKVLSKYHRQLTNLHYNAIDLVDLPWTLKIIESAKEFTQPNINIEDDKIILRTPYKLAFVNEFRALGLMKWIHDEKMYTSAFGLHTLKKVLEVTGKHFDEIILSDSVSSIIKQLEIYQGNEIWEPILVRRNGNLYIACINDSLNEVTKNIPLNTDAKTIANLNKFGIKIDETLISELMKEMGQDEEYISTLKLASSNKIQLEQKDLRKIKQQLKAIGCDFVLYGTLFFHGDMKDIDDILDGFKIPHKKTSASRHKIEDPYKNLLANRNHYSMPVLIQYGKFKHESSYMIPKIIELVNNEPIDVK